MSGGTCGIQRITVLGGGVSGLALAELAQDRGWSVFVTDRGSLGEGVERLRRRGIPFEEEGHTPRLYEADLLLLGSGIAPGTPEVQEALRRGIPVQGELDFVAPLLRRPLIGVTGSNGKTTTTALIGHLLNQEGVAAQVAGNIGTPLASLVQATELEWIVAELSSFQLHWSRELRCSLGVVTNLAPDHLDWHGSYEAYTDAKGNLLRCLSPGGAAILQRGDLDRLPVVPTRIPLSWEEAPSRPGIALVRSREEAIWFPESGIPRRLFGFDQVPLLGDHNLENAAMAATAVHLALGREPRALPGSLGTFASPPHRCERAGEWGGVRFVDDSKGTNVAAAVTALSSLPGPKVVLLGGKGKGESYADLARAVKERARYAVLFGAEGPAIGKALSAEGYGHWTCVETLDQAFPLATAQALPGDTVLLSPACTSWDQYRNYKERGLHFCRLVQELRGSSGSDGR